MVAPDLTPAQFGHYDSEMLTAKVTAAYNGTSSVEDFLATERSRFELKNYANPFTNHTTISFNQWHCPQLIR